MGWIAQRFFTRRVPTPIGEARGEAGDGWTASSAGTSGPTRARCSRKLRASRCAPTFGKLVVEATGGNDPRCPLPLCGMIEKKMYENMRTSRRGTIITDQGRKS
jgi:hypothetical protein